MRNESMPEGKPAARGKFNGNGKRHATGRTNGHAKAQTNGHSPATIKTNGKMQLAANGHAPEGLMRTPLLPEGFYVPATRNIHPSKRMRELLETEPYLFGPSVYDPMTAQLVMYYGWERN